ncbi:hypothetical protein [Streptomyces vinaceus]|uniref:hypothetical protein n=1 Tax=Streptomyces vinaceus TaxID=1960 RepID=UPI0036A739AB
MHVRPRPLIVPAVLAALVAALTACSGHPDRPAAAARSASAPPSASASPSATAPATATPSGPAPTPTPATASASSAAPARTPAAAPAPATRLALTAAAATGGGLKLVRGGPAQEFTVTVHNGNSQAYGHLLVAFQMEPLTGEPGDLPGPATPFVLERRDPATGAWRAADLRIAADAKPAHLHTGGTALARDAVRTERYRLRATATGPTGSSPLMVYAIDTDAAEGTRADFEHPGHVSLPLTTRRVL